MAGMSCKKKHGVLKGRGICEKCKKSIRTKEWGLPWHQQTGYMCDRYANVSIIIYSQLYLLSYLLRATYLYSHLAIVTILSCSPYIYKHQLQLFVAIYSHVCRCADQEVYLIQRASDQDVYLKQRAADQDAYLKQRDEERFAS